MSACLAQLDLSSLVQCEGLRATCSRLSCSAYRSQRLYTSLSQKSAADLEQAQTASIKKDSIAGHDGQAGYVDTTIVPQVEALLQVRQIA